jgi:hypothetical protein
MAFVKGKSGNPGGRPRENSEIKELARKHGPAAIKRLVELMKGSDPRVAVAAAQALLDRGYGKPAQAIVGGETGDNPLDFVTEIRLVPMVAANATDPDPV